MPTVKSKSLCVLFFLMLPFGVVGVRLKKKSKNMSIAKKMDLGMEKNMSFADKMNLGMGHGWCFCKKEGAETATAFKKDHYESTKNVGLSRPPADVDTYTEISRHEFADGKWEPEYPIYGAKYGGSEDDPWPIPNAYGSLSPEMCMDACREAKYDGFLTAGLSYSSHEKKFYVPMSFKPSDFRRVQERRTMCLWTTCSGAEVKGTDYMKQRFFEHLESALAGMPVADVCQSNNPARYTRYKQGEEIPTKVLRNIDLGYVETCPDGGKCHRVQEECPDGKCQMTINWFWEKPLPATVPDRDFGYNGDCAMGCYVTKHLSEGPCSDD